MWITRADLIMLLLASYALGVITEAIIYLATT